MPNQLPTAEELTRKCASTIDNAQEQLGVMQQHELEAHILYTIPLVELLAVAKASFDFMFRVPYTESVCDCNACNFIRALNNLHSKFSTTKENK